MGWVTVSGDDVGKGEERDSTWTKTGQVPADRAALPSNWVSYNGWLHMILSLKHPS